MLEGLVVKGLTLLRYRFKKDRSGIERMGSRECFAFITDLKGILKGRIVLLCFNLRKQSPWKW